MKKFILSIALIAFTATASMAQFLSTAINNGVGQNGITVLFRSMSPTNNYANRLEFEFRHSPGAVAGSTVKGANYLRMEWDTIRYSMFPNTRNDGAITALYHPLNSDGKMGVSPISQLVIPWAQITGAPTFYSFTGSSSQYTKGDGTYATLNTANVPELTNQYYTDTRARAAFSAGTGLSYSGGVYTNISPDQTVAITGTNGITATGTYPNFTVSHSKRQETYSGNTNASGIYAVTFPVAYSVAPNIQVNIIGGTNKTTQLTTVTTTGFSIYVQLRADVLGLLPSYSNVSAQPVDVLITEK